uniref:Protein kinase domain-containing protein n=1 Tax=Panagrolaimus sp. PS1159 TaxID=55785 RepID=A0AC35G053_9BILA
MSGGTDRRNLSRKVKTAESWDKRLSEYDRDVTRVLQTGRLPQTTIATPKPKSISVATKSSGIKLSKPNLLATQPAAKSSQNAPAVAKAPTKRGTTESSKLTAASKSVLTIKLTPATRSSKRPATTAPSPPAVRSSMRLAIAKTMPVDAEPISTTRSGLKLPKLVPLSKIKISPDSAAATIAKPLTRKAFVSATLSSSRLKAASKTVLTPSLAATPPIRASSRFANGKHKRIDAPVPVASKRPRRNIEPQPHVSESETESDSDLENHPPPVLSPYYADDDKIIKSKGKKRVKSHSLEFSSSLPQLNEVQPPSASPVDELPTPDPTPSTSDVNKFDYFKYDQMELFGDLENEEERVEEYDPGQHYAADIAESINASRTGYKYQIARKMGFGNFSLAWFKSHDHIVRYYRSFKITRGRFKHDCAVFEPLGSTLLTLLKRAKGDGAPVGLTVAAIKKVARHVLLGLQHLHEVLNFVHTDIKPENILTSVTERSLFLAVKEVHDCDCKNNGIRAVSLREKPLKNGLPNVKHDLQKILADTPLPLSTIPATTIDNRKTVSDEICWDVIRFKIIDLGNAVSPSNDPTVSGTFEYRAPENAFGAPLNYSFDVWSVGAVIVELATSKQLFASINENHDPRDLLKSITRYLGKVPYDVYKEFKYSNQFLDEFSTSRSVTFFQRVNLKQLFSPNFTEQEIKEMVAFLVYVFTYDPSERPTVAKCLEHEWLST